MTYRSHQSRSRIKAELRSLVLFKGISILLIGLVLLFFPQTTLTICMFVLGVYWLVDGTVVAYKSIQGRAFNPSWGWGLFTGILGLLAGIFVVAQPLLGAVITSSIYLIFFGIIALVYGISGIITGFRLRKIRSDSGTMITGGLIASVLGLLFISSPYISAMAIIKTIGILAIVGGIAVLIVAYQLKNSF